MNSEDISRTDEIIISRQNKYLNDKVNKMALYQAEDDSSKPDFDETVHISDGILFSGQYPYISDTDINQVYRFEAGKVCIYRKQPKTMRVLSEILICYNNAQPNDTDSNRAVQYHAEIVQNIPEQMKSVRAFNEILMNGQYAHFINTNVASEFKFPAETSDMPVEHSAYMRINDKIIISCCNTYFEGCCEKHAIIPLSNRNNCRDP
jgi:hypothetical protein